MFEETTLGHDLESVAASYHRQGNLPMARQIYVQLVEIKQRAFGRMHATVARSLYSLAEVCSQEGTYRIARDNYSKAVNIWESSYTGGEAEFCFVDAREKMSRNTDEWQKLTIPQQEWLCS